jgi:hypothetical protein
MTGTSAQEKRPANAAPVEEKKGPTLPSIRGVWRVVELASRASGVDWEVRTTPYLSQYIFTEKHYSYMYVPGAGPRKLFAGDPNKPADVEKVEAYNSLVAASGAYKLSGATLTLNALIHKNPNEMNGKSLTTACARRPTTGPLIYVDWTGVLKNDYLRHWPCMFN